MNESVEDDIYEETDGETDGETDLERQPLNSKARESPSGNKEYQKSKSDESKNQASLKKSGKMIMKLLR